MEPSVMPLIICWRKYSMRCRPVPSPESLGEEASKAAGLLQRKRAGNRAAILEKLQQAASGEPERGFTRWWEFCADRSAPCRGCDCLTNGSIAGLFQR